MHARHLTSKTTFYSASEIAEALGKSASSVRAALEGIAATTHKMIAGNVAAAWEFLALPLAIRNELESVAQRNCYRNAEAMLNHSDAPRTPERPLADRPQSDIDKAVKLRAVLLPFLEAKDSEQRSQAQLFAAIAAAYEKQFGHRVSSRWARELFHRTLDRDRGRNDFQRLEIYLDESPGRKSDTGAGKPARSTFDHSCIADVIGILENPANLTPNDCALVWDAVCRNCHELLAVNPGQGRAIKRSLFHFVFGAVPIAKSRESLERTFATKKKLWLQGGKSISALRDRRAGSSGWHRAPDLSDEALNAILAEATFNHGSRLAPAWRDYLAGNIAGVIPDAKIIEYDKANPALKSHVPARIREVARYKLPALKILHHGKYQYEQTGHLMLDDSKLHSMEVISSDDFTPPVYCISPVDGSLIRGQVLISVDRRSRRVLGWCFVPSQNYDSISILGHCISVFSEFGIPQWLEWERGLWQKSKLLKGDTHADFVPPEERERGLAQLGIRFRHRVSPKAKIVERIIGAVQDMMEGEPRYCGRNEQVERFESFRKIHLAAQAGRIDAAHHFYSFEQWNKRLGELIQEYNRTPQGRGTLLDGISPDEAFEKFQNPGGAPSKFHESSRYMLSTHRRVIKESNGNGFNFRIGNRDFWYRSAQTGDFFGQKMLVWFNAIDPSIAYLTDLQFNNPFAVELAEKLHPVNESPEKLANELRKLREHQAPMRNLYNTLKADFSAIHRGIIIAPDAAKVSKAFEQGEQDIKEARNQRRALSRIAGDAGIQLPAQIRNIERVRQGVELEKRLSITDSENAVAPRFDVDDVPAPSETGKPYTLKPSASTAPTAALYWQLWAGIEKGGLGNAKLRHALTQKHLQSNPMPQNMTPEQLGKMIDVFKAILRDSQKAAV